MRFSLFVSLIASAVFIAGPVEAKKRKNQEPTNAERITLGRVMLADGHYDRALLQFDQVELGDEKNPVDQGEYWYFVGLAYDGLGSAQKAAESFMKALDAGSLEPRAALYAAKSWLEVGKPTAALETLKKAPPTASEIPQFYILESRAHFENKDKFSAFGALDRGHSRFPQNLELARKRVLLLVDLGLYQTAVDEAQEFFGSEGVKPEDYVALATSLIKANQKDRASLLLEQAVLLYPEDIDVRRRLAFAYFENERPLSAGDVIYPIALIEAASAQSAAELYVKARKFPRAVRMNARVEDQSAKVKQRLIILLEQNHFEAAAALDRRVERLGLLEDENIAYALAYAHYRSGSFPRMERLLTLITDASLFRKAIELRRSAEACRQSVWKCD